eukprot:6208738-Pleurochrysis_carterae.AAC.1
MRAAAADDELCPDRSVRLHMFARPSCPRHLHRAFRDQRFKSTLQGCVANVGRDILSRYLELVINERALVHQRDV